MKATLLLPRQPDAVDNAPPRTCLVIDTARLQQLDIDGPALRLSIQDQGRRLFPLRRLARIHVMGELHCGFDALLHCAEQQIPVAFFSLQGKLRCQLYYPVFENGVLAHWLEHIEFDVQAQHMYSEWLHLQQLHVLGQIGCRDGAREYRMKIAEERLHALFNKHWNHRRLLEAREWLIGMLTAHLSQLIVKHGLENQSRGKRKLLEDMLPACELWLLYLLAVAVVEHKKPPSVDARGMSHFYQHHAESIEYMVRRMLSQLVNQLESII
jgi:hypothetical protein